MIKQIVIKLFFKMFTRGQILAMLFDKDERIAVENALWRRSEQNEEAHLGDCPLTRYNEVIKSNCKNIAKELHSA